MFMIMSVCESLKNQFLKCVICDFFCRDCDNSCVACSERERILLRKNLNIFQATGGQDSILRIWVLKSCYGYFEEFRQKYSDGESWAIY